MAATVETQSKIPAYVGFVVDHRDSYRGDCVTDYYDVYFDVETATFKSGWVSDWYPSANPIDAPEDILAAYAAHKEAAKAASHAALLLMDVKDRLRAEEREANTPSTGKIVKVVKGRKIPVGTVGQVQCREEGQWGMRLWVEAEGTHERFWISEENVEIVR